MNATRHGYCSRLLEMLKCNQFAGADDTLETNVSGRHLTLTHLHKPFWPKLNVTKGDLIAYYCRVSNFLIPHLKDRAMVMKRYPNGISGEFFFMKRVPDYKPHWLKTCFIEHRSGNVIEFPIVQDEASLLWIINLGCIDLNPWYGRCDDVNRPDYMHFDLDPVGGAKQSALRSACLLVTETLEALGMPVYIKTSGSRGFHIYVPIVRGPTQKEVWLFAKTIAQFLARENRALITAEYRISKRPDKHVLIDYNQNAWGRTLASVYSVRPNQFAGVSAPVLKDEVRSGIRIEELTLKTILPRVERVGDLWADIYSTRKRIDISAYGQEMETAASGHGG